jgi:hypothetical protein
VVTLCNWNLGRTFGDCEACVGYVERSSVDDVMYAGEVMDAFESMVPSVEDALPKLISELVSVSFSAGPEDYTFSAEVTLASGVIADDLVYNKIVYQLSRIFDVYPGVISWSTSAKRQSTHTIVLHVADEPTSTSSSLYLSSLGLILLLVNALL